MRRSLPTLFAIALTVALLAPLPVAFWLALTEAGPGTQAQTPLDWTAFGTTMLVATAASLLAVLIGWMLAALFALTDFPGAAFWSTATLLAFVCPPTVWALGQVYCFGPGGLTERWWGDAWRLLGDGSGSPSLAAAWILAQIHAPLAMLIIGRGMARLHHGGGEAAWISLPPVRWLPWLIGAVRGEIIAAFLLSFALSAGSFAAPHVVQCRLYAIDIYMRAANYLDHASAMVATVPLIIVACAAAALMTLGERTDVSAGLERGNPLRIRLGVWRWPVGGALALYLGATTLLPVAAMIVECRSPQHFFAAVRDADVETANTIRVAVAAAAVATAAGLLLAGCGGRWTSPALRIVVTAPLGAPPLIIGLAYLRVFSALVPRDMTLLEDSGWLLVLALAFRSWPFTARLAILGRSRIAASWDESARMTGMGRWRRWGWIVLPLILDHLAGGAILAFVLATGDVEISQLLCAPGQGTLALRLFTFLHFGPTYVSASLAVLLLAICITPLAAYYIVCQRCLRLI